MNVRAKSNVALDLASGQIDYGLMKAVLGAVSTTMSEFLETYSVSDVVRYESLPINIWWLLAIMFRLQIGQ